MKLLWKCAGIRVQSLWTPGRVRKMRPSYTPIIHDEAWIYQALAQVGVPQALPAIEDGQVMPDHKEGSKLASMAGTAERKRSEEADNRNVTNLSSNMKYPLLFPPRQQTRSLS